MADTTSASAPQDDTAGGLDRLRVYREMLDAASDAIFLHDPDTGQILDVNQTMLEMYGCTREEVPNLTVQDLSELGGMYTVEEAQRLIHLAATGVPQRFEWKARRLDGQSFWVEVILRGVQVEGLTRVLASVRDISGRMETDDRLRARERDLRNLIENVPGAVYRCEVTPPWRMLYVSEGALGVTGRPAEAFVSGDVTYAEIVLPEDLVPLAERTSEAVARHEPFQVEYRVRFPDETIHWVLGRGQATYSSTGKPLFLDGVILDITDRKQAEEAHRRSEELYRLIAENVTDIISLHDEAGRYLYVSPSIERLLGYKPDEMTNRSAFEFIHPDDVASIEAHRVDTVTGRPREAIQFRLVCKDGAPVWVETLSRTLINAENGQADRILAVTRNVSERVRDREALEESEFQYRTLYAAMDEGFSLHELIRDDAGLVTDYRILDANPAFTRLTGIEREQVIGRPATAAYGVPEAPYLGIYRRVAESGNPEWFETYFPPMQKHFSISVFSPRPNVFATVFYDITARKQAETALRESEERFRAMFEQAAVGVAQIESRTGRFVRTNRKYCDIVGYTPEEMSRSTFQQITHPDDLAEDLENMRRLLAGEIRNFCMEKRYFRKDGSLVWVNLTVSPLWQPGEEPRHHVAVVEDITERREVEEEQSRFFALSSALFMIATVDGIIQRVNPAWETALGYKTNEMEGRPYVDFVHPEDSEPTRNEGSELAKGHATGFFTNRYRHRNGSYRTLSWAAHPILDKGLVYALAIDITEHRKVEERLRQTEKMGAIGQLAGGVAHDFNNQLAAIQGYADLLNDRLADPVLKRYTESILVATRRSADLTRQLLAFARKGQYQSLVVDFHNIVHEVVEILERSIDKRIRIRQHLDANPSTVLGDPSQLQNALLNLALNARDAITDSGEIVVATDVRELDAAYCQAVPYEVIPGRYLQITVTDSGTGMTDEVKEHLFEPFFTTKGQGKGTGMGLAAVYGTVKNHRGSVAVRSQLGKGTTVEIHLPLHEALAQTDARGGETDDRPQRPARILVVDDEQLIRDLAAEMLRSMGHQVATCQDGAEALDYYRTHWKEIDLVILDMVMPGRSGRDTFLDLRRINPTIKALLSSGFSVDGEAQKILDEGVQGFLQKPYSLKQLSTKVTEVLQEQGGRD